MKSLGSKYQTCRFQSEHGKEKLTRTPQDERQRNLVLELITVSHLVSYHLKFFVCLVFALGITSYRRRIQNTFCNLQLKRRHPLSENKQDWNQEKTFMIFYFCFFQIVQISKKKNYLNYDYYYPLTVNGQLWPTQITQLHVQCMCFPCHQKNNT